jgi:hypothetical protein
MKAWETKKDLEVLKIQNRIYKQNCITQLVNEFRESYKKHEWIRRVIRFLSKGRFCRLDQYAWTYEILEEVKVSFWYREIEKFHDFQEAEINGLIYHMGQYDDLADTPESVTRMIRIIREVINE